MDKETRRVDAQARIDNLTPGQLLELSLDIVTGQSEVDGAYFTDALNHLFDTDAIPDSHPPIQETDDPHEANRRKILRALVRRVVRRLTFNEIVYMYGKHLSIGRSQIVDKEPYFEHVRDLFTITPNGWFTTDPIIFDEVLGIVQEINKLTKGYDWHPWLDEPYNPDRGKHND